MSSLGIWTNSSSYMTLDSSLGSYTDNLVPRLIQEELSVQIPNENMESIAKLNKDQLIA